VSKGIGRTIIILLAIGVGLLLLYLLISPRIKARSTTSAGVSVDLTETLPDSWFVITGNWPTQCDFDSDGELEQLVVYRYDPPAALGPGADNGLIGGVIFDSQVNRVPQEPSVESPYRPALLVPYKLLPDMYTYKGQGYLGEANIQVTPVPGNTANTNGCLGKEIVVTGTAQNNGNLSAPNFLSIFQWGGEDVGYAGVHYMGSAQIQIAQTGTGAVTGFTTYDRLDARSALCEVQPYTRYLPPGASWDNLSPEDQPLDFRAQESAFTIDFCFGTPLDPYYPEGVVVALLRGGNPGEATPMGNSFLTQAGVASLPPLLSILQDTERTMTFPVLSVTNPGTLGAAPEQGYLCPGLTLTEGDPLWWCAREQVRVITDILVNGKPYQVIWTLISVANDRAVGDVHWRINHVEMQ
jgi:hypothetical protein